MYFTYVMIISRKGDHMRDAFMLSTFLLFLALLYYIINSAVIFYHLRGYDLRRLLISSIYAPYGRGEFELRNRLKKLKKIVYVLLSLFIMLSVAGYSSTNASAKAVSAEGAQGFVEKYLLATSLQQWDQVYTYLHPDIQAKYTKERFISDRKQYGAQFATAIKDYKVGTAVMLSTWVDAKGTGLEYKGVVEVPIAYNFNDGTAIKSIMHLAKAPDGTWRWFWSPSDFQQIELGQVGELGQFEFKALIVANSKEAKTPTKSISGISITFKIVKFEVTNKGNAPASLRDFEFKLTDIDKNLTYDMNSDVSSSLNMADKKPAVYLYADMNPNLMHEITLIYEVPSEANLALEITHNNDGVLLKLK